MKIKSCCLCLIFIFSIMSGCSIKRDVPTKNQKEPMIEEAKEDTMIDSSQEEVNTQQEQQPIPTLYGVEIGDKVMIDLEQSIQENGYYCGPAVVQMVLQHFHITKSQDTLANEMATVEISGTEYVDMAHALNKYIFQKESVKENERGYHIQTLPRQEYDETMQSQFHKRMRQNIDEGYPSIIAVNLQTLYADQVVANHFVVCSGYVLKHNSDEVAFYYIMDPYYKVQDTTYQGLKVFTPEEVFEAVVENVEPAYIW